MFNHQATPKVQVSSLKHNRNRVALHAAIEQLVTEEMQSAPSGVVQVGDTASMTTTLFETVSLTVVQVGVKLQVILLPLLPKYLYLV